MNVRLTIYSALALLAVGSVCEAESVAEKKEIRAAQAQFEKNVSDFHKSCAIEIPVTYDLKSEPTPSVHENGHGAGRGYGECEQVVNAIAKSCKDADARAAIAEKIKSISCRFEKDNHVHMIKDLNSTGPDLLLGKNGTLTVKFDWDNGNMGSETEKWIMHKL